MFNNFIPNLVPKAGVVLGGVALAGVTLAKRYSSMSEKTAEEREFVRKFGRPTEQQRLDAYQNILKSDNCLSDDMGDFESNSWVKKHRKRMYSMAKGSVVDVGIGPGARSLPLLDANKRVTSVTALDILPEALEKSKEHVTEMKMTKPVKLVQGDMHKLPFRTGQFDTAVSCFALCSAEDPVAYLKELGRVSNDKVLLLEHGLSSYAPVRWLGQWLGVFPNVQAPWDLGCYQDRSPSDLCEKAGLIIISRERSLVGHVYLIVAKGTGEAESRGKDESLVYHQYSPD
jgi:SAM-dependent methyltransferase